MDKSGRIVSQYTTVLLYNSLLTESAGSGSYGNGQAKATPPDPSQKDAPPLDTIDYPEEEINPDDIPF